MNCCISYQFRVSLLYLHCSLYQYYYFTSRYNIRIHQQGALERQLKETAIRKALISLPDADPPVVIQCRSQQPTLTVSTCIPMLSPYSGPSAGTKAATLGNCIPAWRFASTDQLYPPGTANSFSGPALTHALWPVAGFVFLWQPLLFKELWTSVKFSQVLGSFIVFNCPLFSALRQQLGLCTACLCSPGSHFTPLLNEQFCVLIPLFK